MYRLKRRSLHFEFEKLKNGESNIYLNGKLTKYTITKKGELISYTNSHGIPRKILTPFPLMEDRRLVGNLCLDKVRYSFNIDRLMVEAFFIDETIGEDVQYERGQVMYKDGDFTNVDVNNIVFLSNNGIKISYEGGKKKVEKSNIV